MWIIPSYFFYAKELGAQAPLGFSFIAMVVPGTF